MTINQKLHPARFDNMSPRMAAIVGYYIDESWVEPSINSMAITSDGFIMAAVGEDIGANSILGSASDLSHNLSVLFEAAELTDDEYRFFGESFLSRTYICPGYQSPWKTLFKMTGATS